MMYLYDDEDNIPMSEEHMPPKLQNCRDRCRYSKICEKQYHCQGSTDPSYPFECAIYAKIDDLVNDAIPFFDPDEPSEEEYDDNEDS